MITTDQLHQAVQCPMKRAEKWIKPINAALAAFHIDTPLRISHFLAQVGHESARLYYVAEIASGAAYDNREDLGNTRPEAIHIAKLHGSTPGRWWKGHGLIQITGYDNHKACGGALAIDLLNSPSSLEQPDYAAMSAAWFWDRHGLNALADKNDIRAVTKKINGGYNGLDDRVILLTSAKQALRIRTGE